MLLPRIQGHLSLEASLNCQVWPGFWNRQSGGRGRVPEAGGLGAGPGEEGGGWLQCPLLRSAGVISPGR